MVLQKAFVVLLSLIIAQIAVASQPQDAFTAEMKSKEDQFSTRLSNLEDHISLTSKHEKSALLQDLTAIRGQNEKFVTELGQLNSNAATAEKLKPDLTAKSEKIDSEIKRLERRFKK